MVVSGLASVHVKPEDGRGFDRTHFAGNRWTEPQTDGIAAGWRACSEGKPPVVEFLLRYSS